MARNVYGVGPPRRYVTLHRGNVLTFENTKGSSRPRAVEFYETKSEAEPCVPMKVSLPHTP
ncbi:hypothetical protein ACFYS7_39365 [Streptomyces avermitilis]|uniref:hypothetical protein n=1 Tax=Streptomyces avermitilis TaxID=33903 RepID=UPI0036BE1C7C